MSQRRPSRDEDHHERERAEERPAIHLGIHREASELWVYDSYRAGHEEVEGIDAKVVEEDRPESAHACDSHTVSPAPLVDLVPAWEHPSKRGCHVVAASPAQRVAYQVLYVSQSVRPGVDTKERRYLTRLVEEAQKERIQDRTPEAEVELIAHVYAKGYGQQDVEEQLPERHAHEVILEGGNPKCLVMPVQPDLFERNQVKVILLRVSYGRCPVRKRQADHEERDQHVENEAVDDEGPVL